MAVLVVGNFMAVLDITIVNVAVPTIQKEFGGGLDDVLWIATAYTLTLGVVVPLSGWLGDRFGLVNVYLASLAAFALGSALCGLAWNLDTLIAFRILQAVPGGIMPVVAMTLVYRIVPPQKIGSAMGLFGLGVIFAPATGPVLGGYLVQYLDWRLVFYINVPVGLLGALAAFMVLPKLPAAIARPFDFLGFGCIAFGLFAILLAASEGEDWGWTGYRVLLLAAGGVLALTLFVVIELEVEHPLLDVRMFGIWPFTNSLILISIITVNLLAIAFYIPVFLQQGQGKEAFDAGLLLLPQAVATGMLAPISGRLYDKIGPRALSVIGLIVCAFGTYLLAGTTADLTREHLILWTCVRGWGLGLAMMPIMTAGIAAVPPSRTNQASALNNVARQVAGALGLAGLAALASIQQAQLMANRAALTTIGHAGVDPAAPGAMTQLYGRYRELSLQVLATSYANIFLVVAGITAAGVVLALGMRPPPRRGGPALPD
ncbi:DHA2 family efflux MFS transporter permease subunit [Pseudonocardia eucalypti]|uniref:DHA2 family efflux MFS transporter permease subunit n=1 Tax=Pseudonocardia eucalypti TaxID=648755 RepID=A0ABP9R8F5_9PSEU|nr:EmrB/QacA subfamily drug resistance transporter [Pseudonocardia eucalypti]